MHLSSYSDRFEFEPLPDDLHGFGQCIGTETEGVLDEAGLTANVADNVEDRRLVFAERAHHLEAFDRRIVPTARLQRRFVVSSDFFGLAAGGGGASVTRRA